MSLRSPFDDIVRPSQRQKIKAAHDELPEDCRSDPAGPAELEAFEKELGLIPEDDQKRLDILEATGRLPVMTRSVVEITDEAVALPSSDQLKLARTLLEKSEASGDMGVEAAWEQEIELRIQKIDAGLAKGRSFADVLRDVDHRFGQ